MEPVVIAILVGAVVAVFAFHFIEMQRINANHENRLREATEKAAEEAVKRSSFTIKGQVGERFAPFKGGFKYEPADARFLGSPVDYVVFDGMSEGEIKSVVLVEVKVGRLPLTPFQRQVQEAIKKGRVEWRIQELEDPTATNR